MYNRNHHWVTSQYVIYNTNHHWVTSQYVIYNTSLSHISICHIQHITESHLNMSYTTDHWITSQYVIYNTNHWVTSQYVIYNTHHWVTSQYVIYNTSSLSPISMCHIQHTSHLCHISICHIQHTSHLSHISICHIQHIITESHLNMSYTTHITPESHLNMSYTTQITPASPCHLWFHLFQGMYTRITFREDLYMGGFRNNSLIGTRTGMQWGFVGCVRYLEVNGKIYDMRKGAFVGDAVHGIDVSKYTSESLIIRGKYNHVQTIN